MNERELAQQLLAEGAVIIDKAKPEASKPIEVAPLVEGELVPLKGVWFRVTDIQHVELEGKAKTVVVIVSEGVSKSFVKKVKRQQAKHNKSHRRIPRAGRK